MLYAKYVGVILLTCVCAAAFAQYVWPSLKKRWICWRDPEVELRAEWKQKEEVCAFYVQGGYDSGGDVRKLFLGAWSNMARGTRMPQGCSVPDTVARVFADVYHGRLTPEIAQAALEASANDLRFTITTLCKAFPEQTLQTLWDVFRPLVASASREVCAEQILPTLFTETRYLQSTFVIPLMADGASFSEAAAIIRNTFPETLFASIAAAQVGTAYQTPSLEIGEAAKHLLGPALVEGAEGRELIFRLFGKEDALAAIFMGADISLEAAFRCYLENLPPFTKQVEKQRIACIQRFTRALLRAGYPPLETLIATRVATAARFGDFGGAGQVYIAPIVTAADAAGVDEETVLLFLTDLGLEIEIMERCLAAPVENLRRVELLHRLYLGSKPGGGNPAPRGPQLRSVPADAVGDAVGDAQVDADAGSPSSVSLAA